MRDYGVLISVSGIDGSGKSTYLEYIYNYLKQTIQKDIIICDAMKPCTFNNQLKSSAKNLDKNLFEVFTSEFIGISYGIDLINNLEHIIAPALKEGKIILTHRYDLCCKAYSEAMGGKSKILDKILSLCLKPDIHFYFDVQPEIAINRIKNRSLKTGEEIKEKENLDVLNKARNNYFKIIQKENRNINIINTEKDIKLVKSDIDKIIDEFFNVAKEEVSV